MNDRPDPNLPQARAAVLGVGRERARQFALCLGFAAIGLLIGAAGAVLGA